MKTKQRTTEKFYTYDEYMRTFFPKSEPIPRRRAIPHPFSKALGIKFVEEALRKIREEPKGRHS